MPDAIDLEPFIQSLIETVVWCRHQLDRREGDVSWPLTGAESVLWNLSDEMLKQHCAHIIADRSQRVSALERPDDEALRPIIEQGQLLILYSGTATSDGVAQIETSGYFDFDNYPPWDTWVYYQTENKQRDQVGYLIAWVAPEFIDGVHGAIESCADESILWLTDLTDKDLSVSVKEALKAAHLWI